MKFEGNAAKIFVLICLLFGVFSPNEAFCLPKEKNIIKVGISNQSFSTYEHKSAKFISDSEILITDMASSSQFKIEPNNEFLVEIKNSEFSVSIEDENFLQNAKGPVVLAANGKIGIVELNRKGTPANYSGMIELKAVKEDKFNIINVLDMQSYLKGVVPNEMPVSFGLEALKAQAVAARNYANRPQSAYKNYDICDSTACQVYYGANSNREISNRAVDETKGIFALYENEPIVALYHSTAGGITEDWKNVYGNGIANEKPYLKSVADDPSQAPLLDEKAVRDYYSKKPESFDIKSPRYRWKVEWTREELENVLNKTLIEQSRAGLVEPKYTGEEKLIGLKDIKVTKRGTSGKALEIEIYFKNGTFKVKKELGIRRTLKKNNIMLSSGNFFIDKGFGEIKDEDEKLNVKEEVIFAFEKLISPTKTLVGALPEKFTITGGGFGHGVGMSQYGAGFMAQNGKKFDTILKHYYSGISIGTMKNEVFYNPYNVNYKTTFYFSKKMFSSAVLKVDNEKRVSKLDFTINNEHFAPDMTGYSSKMLGMDITNYLKEGENTVEFKALDLKDKGKTVVFQIDLR